jgi:hypothetical protein
MRRLPVLTALSIAGMLLPGICRANLLVNGDFQLGDVGFMSQYQYSPGDLWPQGTYDVVSNPQSDNGNFVSMFDHTFGTASGLMLAVNGATGPYLWQETIIGTADTSYIFSGWQADFDDGSHETLALYLGSTEIGTTPALTDDGVWHPFTINFNSGTSSTLVLSIYDLDNAFSGNDFGLDDLSLVAAVPEPATMTMLACGLGMLFLVTRRRARTQ